MKYVAIHSDGYGGDGVWAPAFEIDAVDAESRPDSVKALEGPSHMSESDILSYLENYPNLRAGDLAKITGPQHVGILARDADGMVVFDHSGYLEDEDEYHWTEKNIPEDSEDPLRDAEELLEEWENSR